MKVINAFEKFAKRKQENEFQELKGKFMDLFGHLNEEELETLFEIMDRGDKQEFLRFTKPIIMHRAIRDFNKDNIKNT